MEDKEHPILVEEATTGSFGLYHPGEDIIETYVGNDREELPGEYLGETWHETDQDDLQASIKTDIEDVRGEIDEIRSRDLTDEQDRELDRLESRLESQENVLELAEEVHDGDD